MFPTPHHHRRFGIYSSASGHQCCSRTFPGADDGSYGREALDARQFAKWGVDYLKHDDCTPPNNASYTAMRDALNATGRRIYYSTHPNAYGPFVCFFECKELRAAASPHSSGVTWFSPYPMLWPTHCRLTLR